MLSTISLHNTVGRWLCFKWSIRKWEASFWCQFIPIRILLFQLFLSNMAIKKCAKHSQTISVVRDILSVIFMNPFNLINSFKHIEKCPCWNLLNLNTCWNLLNFPKISISHQSLLVGKSDSTFLLCISYGNAGDGHLNDLKLFYLTHLLPLTLGRMNIQFPSLLENRDASCGFTSLAFILEEKLFLLVLLVFPCYKTPTLVWKQSYPPSCQRCVRKPGL